MLFYRLIAGLALLGAAGWVYAKPGWDSMCAVLAAFAALAATFIPMQKTRGQQAQNVEQGGIGIQAGRDAHVGNIDHKG